MAIYIGLKIKDRMANSITYTFFKSDGQIYGTLMVDTETKDIRLLDAVDERAKEFAFPRACRAIEKAFKQG